jgi:hypothetical protein
MQSNERVTNRRSMKGKRAAAKTNFKSIQGKDNRTTSDGLLRDLTCETVKSRDTVGERQVLAHRKQNLHQAKTYTKSSKSNGSSK